jgi:hypothetical protein
MQRVKAETSGSVVVVKLMRLKERVTRQLGWSILARPMSQSMWVTLSVSLPKLTMAVKFDSPKMYNSSQSLFENLQSAFRKGNHVEFFGGYHLPEDPLITARQRVRMTIHDIWKTTGYRFTYVNGIMLAVWLTSTRVKDHPSLETGHKTRLWCCQDLARKKKSKVSLKPNAINRDTVGMCRYDCKSSLTVICRASSMIGSASGEHIILIKLQHHENHIPYYNVSMPDGASDIIRESLEWSTPVSLVPKIQALYPNVSAKQVHSAWSEMSETLWRREEDQLLSAEKLLVEYPDEVDVLEVPKVDGVEQLCWGMKRIVQQLKGMVVEIGIDATCACASVVSEWILIVTIR